MALPVDLTNNHPTKVVSIKRDQKSWGDDSSTIDVRLINDFIEKNPNADIISVFHSGVNNLLIIYKS